MKKFNKNKKAVNFKKLAFDFAKNALLLLIAFIVEQAVGHFLVGLDSAVLDFALNEFGNMIVLKALLKVLMLIAALRAKNKKSS